MAATERVSRIKSLGSLFIRSPSVTQQVVPVINSAAASGLEDKISTWWEGEQ